MAYNPRKANGNLRRKYRDRIRAEGLPCHICGKSIAYDQPSDSNHPWSLVLDEVLPVSRWAEFGYSSPRAAAEDYTNVRPAHWKCNQIKRDMTMKELRARLINNNEPQRELRSVSDGDW